VPIGKNADRHADDLTDCSRQTTQKEVELNHLFDVQKSVCSSQLEISDIIRELKFEISLILCFVEQLAETTR